MCVCECVSELVYSCTFSDGSTTSTNSTTVLTSSTAAAVNVTDMTSANNTTAMTSAESSVTESNKTSTTVGPTSISPEVKCKEMVKTYVVTNKASLCDMSQDELYRDVKANVTCVMTDIPNAENQTDAIKEEFKSFCMTGTTTGTGGTGGTGPASGAEFVSLSAIWLLFVFEIQKLLFG